MADYTPYEDKALMTRIAEGDEAAFEQLYYRYLPVLEPFARQIVKSDLLIGEVVQETFLRVWLNRDRLPEIENPRAWIYKIASNICFSHLTRIAAERKLVGLFERASSQSDDDFCPEFSLHELQAAIHRAVQRMPLQRRKIYELSRGRGLSIGEIAKELDISPNTVKNTLVKALAFIRQQLENGGFILPALILSWVA